MPTLISIAGKTCITWQAECVIEEKRLTGYKVGELTGLDDAEKKEHRGAVRSSRTVVSYKMWKAADALKTQLHQQAHFISVTWQRQCSNRVHAR